MANQNQISQLMQQMQQMQDDLAATQASLAVSEVEGTAGGGAVRVRATAAGELRAVSIRADVVNADEIDLLEDLVLAAVNDALAQAHAQREHQMGAVTAGLNLGDLGLPQGLI
ncbi:MAG: YbaB/EbfC family nucleoid-associated protein [Acidimicrobiia bacterium]